jgi:phage terminase large subunit GpA-like protein
MFNAFSRLWLPPDKLTLSEWAEKNFILSSEYSARSGPLRLHGYQRGILDAISDEHIRKVVLMCSSQVIKTLAMQVFIAHIIAETPAPILLVEPTDKDARAFSKERLEPMIRDNAYLKGKLTLSGPGREGTITEKMFPGGSLAIVGAGAAGNFKRRSVCFLCLDEVDEYDVDVSAQGDAISLGEARLTTYGSRAKTIIACSPTNEHTSRIAREYQQSDQREPWVACHACGERQVLKFSQVKWDNTLPIKQRPDTAHYECISCQAKWTDIQRWKSCEDVVWIAQQPFNGVAGYWLNHLYSPWHALSKMVREFLAASDDWAKRKTFVNTSLAELWRTEGISPDDEKLYARREAYKFGDDAVVPSRAVFLTASCDVQADRLEVEVRAWGRNKESWSVCYEVIQPLAVDGKTPLPSTAPEVWAELDRRILSRDWPHEDGGTLPIMLMAIDTGFNSQTVYEYCLKHPQPAYSPTAGMRVRAMRSVVPIRGNDDELKIISGISSENAARKRQNVRIVSLGTHCIKSELYDILRNVRPNGDEGVANCIHFPVYNLDYFKGLCSEHRVVKANGSHDWQKKPNARNEPLDLAVYNRGAASLCGIERFQEQHWLQMEVGLHKNKVQPATPTEPPPTPLPTRTPVVPPAVHRPQRRVIGRFL